VARGRNINEVAGYSRAEPGHALQPLLQSIIDAMLPTIAVLDSAGTIVLVNRSWRDFGRRNGLTLPDAGIGVSYLDVCEKAVLQVPAAARCLAGLCRVIDGATDLFRHDYDMPVDGAERHFVMTACALDLQGAQKILVSHDDVTLLVQAQEEIRNGAIRLLEGQERERRHIAREIHDSLSQELTAIKLLSGQLGRATTDARGRVLEEMDEVVDRAIQMIRTFSFLLHSRDSAEANSIEAMDHLVSGFARRSGLEVTFTARVARTELLDPIHVPLFRIAQEGLSNVHRHSGATKASVMLHEADGAIVLTIADDGRGFDPAAVLSGGTEGVGIAGMRARAVELGGSLQIRSTRRGTQLVVKLPA
jgi:two-component system NarL family sensor kinase